MTDPSRLQPTATRKGQTPIKVYCLPEEFQEIRAHADSAGMSASTYLRQLGMGYEPPSVLDRDRVEVLAKVNADQARLGNLLKMWLADDAKLAQFDAGQMRATILLAMDRIKECQTALFAAARRL